MTTIDVKADAAVAESDKPVKGGGAGQVDQDLIGQLVAQAREQGLELTGEGGDDAAEDWVATNAAGAENIIHAGESPCG